jgi:hypothetical protein
MINGNLSRKPIPSFLLVRVNTRLDARMGCFAHTPACWRCNEGCGISTVRR